MAALPQTAAVAQVAPTTFVQNNETNAPRALVQIDGATYTPKRYSLDLNVHGSSDTATVVVPVATYPDWTQAIARSDALGNADQPVFIKIYAGFPSDPSNVTISQLSLRFYGVVDQYVVSRKADETTFSCRSLAAPLITHKVTVGLKTNQTTVSFVQQVAAQFNLQTNIQCPSPATLTQVLAQNFIAGIRLVGIWDLLVQCAQFDDVAVWVDETGTLWYANPTGLARTNLTLNWGEHFADLEITHSPQFSKNIQVEVRSYQKRTKTSTTYRVESNADGGTATASSSRTVTTQPIFGTNETVSTSTSASGVTTSTQSTLTGGTYTGTASAPAAFSGKERYIFPVKNQSPQACADLAQKLWRQISEHEYSIAFSIPVTEAIFASLSTTAQLNVTTGFQQADGAYWPRTISERFDPLAGGYVFEGTAVNHEYAQGQVN